MYERLRRTLADELGVDPTPPLQALHQRILTADPADGSGPSKQALGHTTGEPCPGVPGRQRRCRCVNFPLTYPTSWAGPKHWPRSPGCSTAAPNRAPVAVIVGGPGVGKVLPRDARCAAGERQLPRRPALPQPRGNIGRATGPGADAGRGTARALDRRQRDPERPGRASRALYRSLLVDRHMLVVLDDAGHADQVLPLLPAADGCAVLITSRTLLTQLPARARHIDLDVLSRQRRGSCSRELSGGGGSSGNRRRPTRSSTAATCRSAHPDRQRQAHGPPGLVAAGAAGTDRG